MDQITPTNTNPVKSETSRPLTAEQRYLNFPIKNGGLTIYADQVGLEVFASEGHTFVPMPINLKPEDTSLAVSTTGGSVVFDQLDVHELRGVWP